MSSPTTPADLLDLKLMPSWVNESAQPNDYSQYEGESEQSFRREGRWPQRGHDQRQRGPRPQGRRDDRRDDRKRPDPRRPDQRRTDRPPERREQRDAPALLPQVAVRFLPHPRAFESVIAQIKAGPLAYSVFALARLFLEKPERYEVRLTAPEGAVLHQLGEHGPVAIDTRILESGAFTAMRDEFFTVEETQVEPIKGNFTNVARDRISGTLIGPTNHHSYQPQLRSLYEQRYSRRMSFPDFQRQIEIVSDPAVVEQWKEQARSITTYTTKNQEPPVTFDSLAEAERHFRQNHLPMLLRTASELTISGVVSRQLSDRGLGRMIEDAWATEIRSPSKMMQELASGLRPAGLNIFRHRRGMLFVSPIRTRTFGHERAGVSPSINAILEKLAEAPGISRKHLAEQLAPAGADPAEQERAKRTLASDLRWLVSEGHVIEFNDGTVDLPRGKPSPAEGSLHRRAVESLDQKQSAPAPPANNGAPAAEIPVENLAAADGGAAVAETPFDRMHPADEAIESGEQGGMSVKQSIHPADEPDASVAEAPEAAPAAETERERLEAVTTAPRTAERGETAHEDGPAKTSQTASTSQAEA